jgi:5-hydroxyisourate hydrolase-like protein (transthyretin family)
MSCVINYNCSKTNKKIDKQGKYDGTYNLSCISKNVYAAVGDIEIKSSKISGTIVNAKNYAFNITGKVNDNGIILFNTITNSLGKIAAIGQISEEGIMKGLYSVNTRKGNYFGFRYEKDDIDTNLNGEYEINFHRNHQKEAHLRIQVHEGVFRSDIESVDHVRCPVKGRVLKNGSIIINTDVGSQPKGIVACGRIKGKTLNGTYFLFTGEKGSLLGKRL